MFKIGDFSKLSQVSIKTLHYYERLGLFKPSYVDEQSGYRYYSADQVPRLNRILVLKDLGFSLEQIAIMMDGEMSPILLKEMLQRRQVQILEQLQSEQEKLTRIEARLSQIEKETDGAMFAYDVVLKRIPTQMIYSLRQTIASYKFVGELFKKARAASFKACVKPAGSQLSIYHDHGYREDKVDIEAAIPICSTVSGPGISELYGVEHMACVIHRGSYTTIPSAYKAIMQWIADNSYNISGNCREIYLVTDNEAEDETQIITEVQIPVAK